MRRVVLSVGSLRLELLPSLGGSVGSFQHVSAAGVLDLMRRWRGGGSGEAHSVQSAMFPMVPFANRIAGNRFRFHGRSYSCRALFAGEPLAMHGSGWVSAWEVSEHSAKRAKLRLADPAELGPHAYEAEQVFDLDESTLRVGLMVRNTGPIAMPFGMGLHPWWSRSPSATIEFSAKRFWLEGPGHLATEAIGVPPELNFREAKTVPRTWRDNCYSDWDGRATLRFPQHGFVLRIDASAVFKHLMLYCDPTRDDFCVEPQTHAAGAFDRLGEPANDDSLVVLEPGEALTGTVAFTVTVGEAFARAGGV